MATKTTPVLSTIPAFDAEFGQPGKESLAAPVLKFSWSDGLVKKNRVVIYDYDDRSNIVYDCTITTMALKHQLHNTLDNSDKVQTTTYNLQNGHKYVAVVYVFPEENDMSPASNEVIFYCYSYPTFKFENFTSFFNGNIANVETTSLQLRVSYEQIEGERLNEYCFKVLDYNNKEILVSNTKYSNESSVTLRHTFGGVSETETNAYGELQYDRAYTAVCEGVTEHGIEIRVLQKFVVKPINTGAGALITAENIGDGTVSIVSNYKILNAVCSTDKPFYQVDESGNAYAIDLTDGDYVEFIDGFVFTDPYAIIVKGKFQTGKLLTLKTVDGVTAYLSLEEYTYTNPPLLYFSFTVLDDSGNMTYKIRTDFWYNDIEVRDDMLIINNVDNTTVENGVLIFDTPSTLSVTPDLISIDKDVLVFDVKESVTTLKLMCRNGLFNLKHKNEEVG